jgi:Mce-associated membrane protein
MSEHGWWRRLLGPGRFTVLVVILLLVAAAGYLGLRAVTLSRQATTLATERSEALSDAARYAVDLTSYDYQDLTTAFTAVADDSTPAFAKQYTATSQGKAAQLRADHSVSTGTVVTVGIQDETLGRTADVLVLVDQSVTNTSTPKPQVQRSELRITLGRSGDRWLISDLQLL